MEEKKKMTEEELEAVCMEVISNAGEGRAHIYQALDLYLKGEYKTSLEELKIAEGYLQSAHDAQFQKLMKHQMNGGEVPFHLLILHGMDLLMVSSAERDMLKHIIMSKI